MMFDIPKTNEPRKVVITEACINEGETPKIYPLDGNDNQDTAANDKEENTSA